MKTLAIVLMILYCISIAVIPLTSAFVIKTFYDDRVSLSLKRMIICIGSTLGVFVYTIFMGLCGIRFIDNIELVAVLAVVPLMLTLLVFQPIVLFYRHGMRIMYYIESVIMFFIVTNIVMISLVVIAALIVKLMQILDFSFELITKLSGNTLILLVYLACFTGIVMCIWLYFAFVRKKVFLKMRVTDTVMFLLYSAAAYYGFSMVTAASNESLPKLIRASEVIFVILLVVIMPVLILKNRQSAYYNEMSTRNEQFLEAELIASNAYRQSQEDTRAFRHDMNNNLSLVSMMMKKGEFSKAEEYINGLCGKLSSFSPRVVTGDDMLDSLISSKLPAIEEKGIRFTIDGVIDGGLGWKPIDICAVFANMIDNAVEACERITGTEKYIALTLRRTEHQRVITMRNSSPQRVDCAHLGDSSHYTSKADRSRHGFGVKNIKDTAEKNGAMIHFESSDTEFLVSVMIMRSEVAV